MSSRTSPSVRCTLVEGVNSIVLTAPSSEMSVISVTGSDTVLRSRVFCSTAKMRPDASTAAPLRTSTRAPRSAW